MAFPSSSVTNFEADSDPRMLSSRVVASSDVSSGCISNFLGAGGEISRLANGTEQKRDTSIQMFRRWLKKVGTEIDASRVVSKACFDDWCLGRSSQ